MVWERNVILRLRYLNPSWWSIWGGLRGAAFLEEATSGEGLREYLPVNKRLSLSLLLLLICVPGTIDCHSSRTPSVRRFLVMGFYQCNRKGMEVLGACSWKVAEVVYTIER